MNNKKLKFIVISLMITLLAACAGLTWYYMSPGHQVSAKRSEASLLGTRSSVHECMSAGVHECISLNSNFSQSSHVLRPTSYVTRVCTSFVHRPSSLVAQISNGLRPLSYIQRFDNELYPGCTIKDAEGQLYIKRFGGTVKRDDKVISEAINTAKDRIQQKEKALNDLAEYIAVSVCDESSGMRERIKRVFLSALDDLERNQAKLVCVTALVQERAGQVEWMLHHVTDDQVTYTYEMMDSLKNDPDVLAAYFMGATLSYRLCKELGTEKGMRTAKMACEEIFGRNNVNRVSEVMRNHVAAISALPEYIFDSKGPYFRTVFALRTGASGLPRAEIPLEIWDLRHLTARQRAQLEPTLHNNFSHSWLPRTLERYFARPASLSEEMYFAVSLPSVNGRGSPVIEATIMLKVGSWASDGDLCVTLIEKSAQNLYGNVIGPARGLWWNLLYQTFFMQKFGKGVTHFVLLTTANVPELTQEGIHRWMRYDRDFTKAYLAMASRKIYHHLLRESQGGDISGAGEILQTLRAVKAGTWINPPVPSTEMLSGDGTAGSVLRPLALGERKQDTAPLLDIKDFIFLRHLTAFSSSDGKRSGISKVLLFQYRRDREKKGLPNGVMLQPGGVYVIKFAASEDRCETYIVPTKKYLQNLNPANNNRNLPVMVGYVELNELTDFRSDIGKVKGQGIVTEFINGETMKERLGRVLDIISRLKKPAFIRLLEHRNKRAERAIVRGGPYLMLRVVKGFKEVFVYRKYIHGDLDLGQVMIREKDGEPVYFDLDTITPQRYDPSEEQIVRRRRLVVKSVSAGSDRQIRIDNKDSTTTDRLCLPRDDIYSLCDMLATYCASLCVVADALGEKGASNILNGFFVCFSEYAALSLSESEYNEEERQGSVIDKLIRDLERIIGISASPVPTPHKPHAEQAASSVLRPLAAADRREPVIGPATAALRIRNSLLVSPEEERVFVMTTTRCPLKFCAHCIGEGCMTLYKNVDADEKFVCGLFDELRGCRNVFIPGVGEPTADGLELPSRPDYRKFKPSDKFLRQVWYAYDCGIQNLYIITNGWLVPEDLEEARKFFEQFPPNIVWLFSFGDYHEKRFATLPGRSKKSLIKIAEIAETLEKEGAIRTAYNFELGERSLGEELKRYGLVDKYRRDPGNVYYDVPTQLGGAARKGFGRSQDLISAHARGGEKGHAVYDPHETAFFVTIDRYVVTSAFVAFMTPTERADNMTGHPYIHWDEVTVGPIASDLPLTRAILSRKGIFNRYSILRGERLFGNIYDELTARILLYGHLYSLGRRDGKILSGEVLSKMVKGWVERDNRTLTRTRMEEAGISRYDEIAPLVLTAFAIYRAGDSACAWHMMQQVDAQTRSEALSLMYFLSLRCEHLDMSEFMAICLLGDRGTSGVSGPMSLLWQALQILDKAADVRQICESGMFFKAYDIRRWANSGAGAGVVPCPVYEAGGDKTKDWIGWLADTGVWELLKDPFRPGRVRITGPYSKDEAAAKFSEDFWLAEVGVGTRPIGILDTKTKDRAEEQIFYYIKESPKDLVSWQDFFSDNIRRFGKGPKADLASVRSRFKNLGALAARMKALGMGTAHWAGFGADTLALRGEEWVLTDRSVVLPASTSCDARDAFLRLVRIELNTVRFGMGGLPQSLEQIILTSFEKGYREQMERAASDPLLTRLSADRMGNRSSPEYYVLRPAARGEKIGASTDGSNDLLQLAQVFDNLDFSDGDNAISELADAAGIRYVNVQEMDHSPDIEMPSQDRVVIGSKGYAHCISGIIRWEKDGKVFISYHHSAPLWFLIKIGLRAKIYGLQKAGASNIALFLHSTYFETTLWLLLQNDEECETGEEIKRFFGSGVAVEVDKKENLVSKNGKDNTPLTTVIATGKGVAVLYPAPFSHLNKTFYWRDFKPCDPTSALPVKRKAFTNPAASSVLRPLAAGECGRVGWPAISGKTTKMQSIPGRLSNMDPLILSLLDEQSTDILDVGIGYPFGTVLELADRVAVTNPNVKITGMDINLPAVVVKTAFAPADFRSGVTLIFNKKGELVAVNALPYSYTGADLMEKSPQVYRLLIETRDRLAGQLESAGTTQFTDESGNSITIDPAAMPENQRANLSYVSADILANSLPGNSVNVIRDFNNTALYYKTAEERQAVFDAEGRLLKNGGHIVLGLTSPLRHTEECFVYQKKGDGIAPVPVSFVFSIDKSLSAVEHPGAESAATPSYFGENKTLYEDYMRTVLDLIPGNWEEQMRDTQMLEGGMLEFFRYKQQEDPGYYDFFVQQIVDGLNRRGYAASVGPGNVVVLRYRGNELRKTSPLEERVTSVNTASLSAI